MRMSSVGRYISSAGTNLIWELRRTAGDGFGGEFVQASVHAWRWFCGFRLWIISTFDVLNGYCIGFFSVMGSPSPLFFYWVPPFYNGPFFRGGSSCHFISTRTIPIDRPFLLFPRHAFSSFQGKSFFQPCFRFFSRSCRIVSVILAYFSRLLSSAISLLFLGKVRTFVIGLKSPLTWLLPRLPLMCCHGFGFLCTENYITYFVVGPYGLGPPTCFGFPFLWWNSLSQDSFNMVSLVGLLALRLELLIGPTAGPF